MEARIDNNADEREHCPEGQTDISHHEEVFFVNEEPIVVRAATLTVREILDDAGLAPGEHALFEHRDGADSVVGGSESPVGLRQGMRFTARRTRWHIWVNGDEVVVSSDVLTFDQVAGYAKDLIAPGPGVEYTIGFEKATHPHEGNLITGEAVRIKNGTEFEVSATNCS
jgi:uncharacterized protein YacL (UPF0231 family)